MMKYSILVDIVIVIPSLSGKQFTQVFIINLKMQNKKKCIMISAKYFKAFFKTTKLDLLDSLLQEIYNDSI